MDEDEYQGPTSQNQYSAAFNYLTPMGDPLAWARAREPSGAGPVAANYPMSVGTTTGFAPTDVRSPYNYPGPQGVYMPGGTSRVDIAPGRGGGDYNPLQPSDVSGAGAQDPTINALGGLLQMRGMMDMAGVTPTGVLGPETSPTSAGGHSVAPKGASAVNAGPYEDMVKETVAKYGLDENLFKRQLWRESQFDKGARSSAGALGVGQFMPATARQYGLRVDDKVDERLDPNKSIDAAGKYMQFLLKKYNGNQQLALAGYNTGEGNVDKWLKGNWKLEPETMDYVKWITGNPLVRPGVQSFAEGGVVLPESSQQPGGTYVGSVYDEGTRTWRDARPGETPGSVVGAVPTEIGRSGTGPGSGGRGVIAGGKPAESEANKPAPDVQPTEGYVPPQMPDWMMGNEQMQRLWKYALLKSLFGNMQFRNINYDPWAIYKAQKSGFWNA